MLLLGRWTRGLVTYVFVVLVCCTPFFGPTRDDETGHAFVALRLGVFAFQSGAFSCSGRNREDAKTRGREEHAGCRGRGYESMSFGKALDSWPRPLRFCGAGLLWGVFRANVWR